MQIECAGAMGHTDVGVASPRQMEFGTTYVYCGKEHPPQWASECSICDFALPDQRSGRLQ